MNNQREYILKTLEASLIMWDVPRRYVSELMDAHHDPFWNFEEKSDGLTFFIDNKWKNHFPPPFVWHDWKMQNIERFRGNQSRFKYVINTNLELSKIMNFYKHYGLHQVILYPILATIAFLTHKR